MLRALQRPGFGVYLSINLSLSVYEGGGGGKSVSAGVVGETLLELLAGEEYAALHGAEGQIHLLGYLLIFVTGNVHREGYAILLIELVDGIGYLAGGKGAFGSFERGVLAEVQVVAIIGGVINNLRAAGAAVVVDEDVAHDGENPALEVGVVGILGLVGQGLDGGVLQKVVSVIAVGGEGHGEVQEVGLKAHKLVLEGCCCHGWMVLFGELMNRELM